MAKGPRKLGFVDTSGGNIDMFAPVVRVRRVNPSQAIEEGSLGTVDLNTLQIATLHWFYEVMLVAHNTASSKREWRENVVALISNTARLYKSTQEQLDVEVDA